jgi:hypothetical protein
LHPVRPRSGPALHPVRPRSKPALHPVQPRSGPALHLARPRAGATRLPFTCARNHRLWTANGRSGRCATTLHR